MAETNADAEPKPLPPERTVPTLKDGGVTLAGLWLLLWYVLSLWLVLGTLSSQSFQSAMVLAGIGDLSKTNIVRSVNEWQEITEERELLASERVAAEKDRASALDMVDFKQAILAEKYSIFRQRFSEITFFGEEIASADSREFKVMIDRIGKITYGFKNSEYSFPSDASFLSLISEAEAAYQIFKGVESELEESRLARETTTRKYSRILDQIKQLENKEFDILKGKRGELLGEFLYLKNFKFDFLALMPNQLLTLFLTLAMGALGSVIHVTRTFFDQRTDEPLSWYFFRPFLGIVTAIAVFVLFKAGQIMISDASSPTASSGDLNPFFISFLAVISGLLSERAYQQILRVGVSTFKLDAEGTLRWGVRVKDTMERQAKTAAHMVRFIDEPVDAVTKWVSEAQPIPERSQSIIAAWLNTPARELFTDMAPNQKPAGTTA